ncbi:MAG: ATP-binding protein [Solirubrobacteraceae bacterium]
MPVAPTFARFAPAEPSSVPFLRREIVGFVAEHDICADRTEDIRLAVSEALTNAVVHAYRGHPDAGELEVRASRTEHSVEVVVCDRGVGMAPRADSPGLGLGLPVIAEIADRFDIEHPGGMGTMIRMRFDC